jgi:hypothetical protein
MRTINETSTTPPANDNRARIEELPAANDNTPAPALTYQVDPWGCVRVLRRPRREGGPSSC